MAETAQVVLAGGGHSHALVLRDFMQTPLPRAELTLVSTAPLAPYSGMLPGEVAGHYRTDETHIDLARLCRAAGVRLVIGEASGIDRPARQLRLADGTALPYDLLSLNLGATPRMQAEGAAAHAVPVKPIGTFRSRWHALLDRVQRHDGATRVAVVGAGAAGVELALALHHRLHAELRRLGRDASLLSLHLVGASPTVLPTHPARVQRRFTRVLAERGIRLHLGHRVCCVHDRGLRTDAGLELPADEVIWVTQAGAAAWLHRTGLALDAQGFVRIHRTLQSVTDPRIFAAGDVASVEGEHLEKAGVVAVRQGPVLAQNLRRALAAQPLVPWQVQRHWLALVSTGDRYAVASRGPFSAAGAWVWRWKDAIDRRFMRQFTQGVPE